MAEVLQYIREIESYIDSSATQIRQNENLDKAASIMNNGVLTIESMVKEMEMYLTTTDTIIRAKGILFLAEVLGRVASMPIDSTSLHSLIGFFSERLADWNAIRGALVGCLGLMRRGSNVGSITDSDGRTVIQSFMQNVQVQSLGQHDRKLCFELMECILDRYPDAAAILDCDEYVYGMCEAIDGEKDPQCLLLTFRIVDILMHLFPDPSGSVASFASDIFEILGSYFPIHFTHHNSEDVDIKRDELSKALMLAFSSSLFEPFAVPLLLEKLSSSLPLAKVESLKYLSSCTLEYGADRMEKHANDIWSSIKEVMYTSKHNPVLTSHLDLQDALDSRDNEIVMEAVILLQKVVMQNDSLFLRFIAADEDINTYVNTISTYKSFSVIPLERIQKLYAIGSIISASAKTSITACSGLFEHFIPRLIDSLGFSVMKSHGDCFSDGNGILFERLNIEALYLSVELLSACRDVSIGCKDLNLKSVSGHETLCSMLQRFSDSLTVAISSTLVINGNKGHDLDSYVGVRGLQIMATFPGAFLPIQKTMYEKILMKLMSIVTLDFDKTLLWRLALKALVQIGSFIEKSDESEKFLSYMNTVIEKIISVIAVDDFSIPFPLKLEVLSDVCASGLKFIPKIIQGLEEAILFNLSEICVHGKFVSVEITIQLLECYSKKVLPWIRKIRGFEEFLLRFAVRILNQIESASFSCDNVPKKELLDATMMAIKLVVGSCSEENQSIIVEKSYNVLLTSTIFPLKESMTATDIIQPSELQYALYSDCFSCRDEWIMSLFASVIMVLHTRTSISNLRSVLGLFMSTFLMGHVPAAQALGSVLNKFPIKNIGLGVLNDLSLDEVLVILFDESVWNFQGIPTTKVSVIGDGSNMSYTNSKFLHIHAIVGLAWIGKGLLMRGHEHVKAITMILLRCILSDDDEFALPLKHCSIDANNEQDLIYSVRKSAADAFNIIMSDSDICLNRISHATIRPLYKQRFFSTVIPILLSSLAKHDLSITRLMVYRAFAHIVCNTPLAAILTEASKVVPILVDGLSTLSEDILNKDIVYDILLVLSGILTDKNGQEVATENAYVIIKHLTGLVSYPYLMVVRETTIQCLVAMCVLPHTRIYPLRTQVLRSISKAFDDPRRAVRQEAVRCHQAWASIASRSSRF